MEPNAAEIAQLRELYSQGQYLQAWALAQRFAPLQAWRGTAARLIGGRLAMQLGAPRLGRQLHLLAWRQAPAHLEAIYYQARYLLERFGPVAAWRFARYHTDWSDAPPELQADWWSLVGFLAGRFRDWERAERFFQKAENLAPLHPWTLVERAGVLEMAEKYEQGLELARRALELRPWYRPAVQAAAHLLFRLGRSQAALELLYEAMEQLECGLLAAQAAVIHYELEQYHEGLKALDRFEALSPLMEDESRQWLMARRTDFLLRLGRYREAGELAQVVREEFYTTLAERLKGLTEETPVPPRRLLLPEGAKWRGLSWDRYLQQWWQQPIPSPSWEGAPPPDGLPNIEVRLRWQDAQWLVRDFRLTAEAAQSLIAQGCPFIVHLVEAGYSQARLVIGYDPLRNTLLWGEPDEQVIGETPLETILERQAAFGPRATVFLPRSAANRLDNLSLPDADLYDALAVIQQALREQDRPSAVATCQRLRAHHPDHLVVQFAELALAHYDAHPLRLLECYDRLLARYPREATWILGKAGVLRELQRWEERESFLVQHAQHPKADPLILLNLAQTLMARAPEREHAAWLVRRALRLRPLIPAGQFLLGALAWERQRFSEAIEHYRFAYTLDDREDQFAEAYARTALALDQAPEALRLFQNKGPRAEPPQPVAVRALYYLLWDRGERDHGLIALNQAIRKLSEWCSKECDNKVKEEVAEPTPERVCTVDTTAQDSPSTAERQAIVWPGQTPPKSAAAEALGELLLFRAEQHAASGHRDAAQQDLEAARPLVSHKQWLRVATRVARCQPDFTTALTYLREWTRHWPMDMEAQQFLVSVLQEVEGRAAVHSYLTQQCQQFPHYYPLLKLRAEFFSSVPEGGGIEAVQTLLQESDQDAWAWRQLALLLADRKRFAEAEQALERAERLEPGHRACYAVRVQLLKRMDRVTEALETLQQALRRDIDQETLISEMLELSRGREEKQAALDFIADELRRQPHGGEGLVAFLQQSHQFIASREEPDPDEHQQLLERLQEILEVRPDLWYAWSTVIHQMTGLGRLEEAETLARAAIHRFPLVSKLWLDYAQVCQGLQKSEERLEALRRAFQLAPGWPMAAQALAEALTEQGNHDESVNVWQLAIPRNPLEGVVHGMLANCLWEVGRAAEALQRVQIALRHDPDYDWAWNVLQLWSERLDQPETPIQFARELTRLRSGNPEVWLRLARLLTQPQQHSEALEALDRALSLDPHRIEAYDLKAERLAEMGRYEEALAAAQPPLLAGNLPLVLQGRVAWIEARRGNYAAAIPPMQALVAIEPTYIWGWYQLAEWYNATGQSEHYLEAAGELVRLQPGHPMHLAMRGEARLKTGDRDGGKEDLREALRIAPGYSYAASLLFDACLADDEIREASQALALLQEHLAGPEVAVKQLQLAVRVRDLDTALRAFTEICEGTGQSAYPLQLALQELKNAGWESHALPLLRKAWQGGGPFHPWVPILWIESPDGQAAEPADRLRAVDTLIKAYPKFAPGYDAKAEQLALLGRYEEALTACQPPEIKPLPVELQARAAWIEAQRMHWPEAITRMRQLLGEHPEFSAGWRYLTMWYNATERYREALEAAEHLVRLEPKHPLSYLLRGEARQRLGDTRGARSDYQQAWNLDPTLEGAGVLLIPALLADNELEAAIRVHATLAEHHDTPWVRLRALQIACHQGNREVALTRFHALARDPDVTLDILREAAQSFDRQQWNQTLTAELKDIASDPTSVPAAATLWVERLVDADQSQRAIEAIPQLRVSHPPGARAALLALLAKLSERGHTVQGLITHHADLLRSDTEAWATAGHALARTGQFAHAAAWLADWRTRPGLTPQMLMPLAWAYRLLDQDQRAADVCHAALQLPAPDHELVYFRAWAALDAALAKRTDEAAQLLARLEAGFLSPAVVPLTQLTRALLLVLTAGEQGRSVAFREARQLLRATIPFHAQIPGLLRAYRKVVRVLIQVTDSFSARCWGFYFLLRSYLQ
jgi:tetratricopeptide (TPR) repeat protein